jgi:hypothetical protein
LPTKPVPSITDTAFRCKAKLEVVVAITEARNVLQLVNLSVCEFDLIDLVLSVCWVQMAVCSVQTVLRCRLCLAHVQGILGMFLFGRLERGLRRAETERASDAARTGKTILLYIVDGVSNVMIDWNALALDRSAVLYASPVRVQ